MISIFVLLCAFSTIHENNAFSVKLLNSRDVVDSVNKFSVNLLKNLKYEEDNIVYSPLSIAIGMGMLLKGAKGNTAKEIRNGLHLSGENESEIHSVIKKTISVYESLEANKAERNVSINLANAALIAKDYSTKEEFVSSLQNDYKALILEADFKKGEEVKNQVNEFVRKNTKGHIDKLLEEPLDEKTRVQLINTLYFEGFWEEVFSKRYTKEQTFYNFDKTESKVEMMGVGQTQVVARYVDHKVKCSFFELRYEGDVSMILVVPHERYGLKSVIDELTQEYIEDSISQFEDAEVTVKLPKFKVTKDIDLKEVLPYMGVRQPFEYFADFSGITEKEDLYVSSALHKATINVDEGGTVAAAVTSIAVSSRSMFGSTANCDHPFAYIIRDNVNGFNLFIGTVNKL